ncbi:MULTISPECIES: hypothetical protein [unclassified Yoonia]|uniref:hypothetical protein n=1 Tax=unclassified Yoonia TaxID=2629118 RepID=UPI002AFFEC09|nr:MULTISPECIES: hypothetical protein [unclassified Yoonia]
MTPVTTLPHATADAGASTHSYVDWAAILAGTIFALAISFVLTSFGAGLGLSLTSPYRGEGVSASWLAIAAGIWMVWVMVTAFGAGGYLTGRMRRPAGDAVGEEIEVRDGSHGLLVWATGAVVGAFLAITGAGGLISAGSNAAGTAAETVTDAVSSDYFASLMLRGSDDINPDAQQEIASLITRAAVEGEMVERDRAYLAEIVATNTTMSEAEARARVDEVNTEIDAAIASATAAIEDARIAGVVFGFIAAATLLLGALAAFFAAVAGGRHRNANLGFTTIMPTR